MSDNTPLNRILIFDDDADLRKLLLVYLTKMFDGVDLEEYDPLVLGAPDESFEWSKYDVLILDYFLCLHGVTGLDILHANRKNPDFPATIMLTGAGNEEVAVRSLKAGVYDYLRKQSLDKKALQKSILNAFEKHRGEKKRKAEITQQGKAFNKSLFYQQLEANKDVPGYRDRVLLYIDLDNHAEIAERAGEIFRDNVVRHIAKHSYDIFKLGECDPSITRIGDASIALLIDAPDSRATLEFNVNGLIKHLEKRPYKFEDQKARFTVSVGVYEQTGEIESADITLDRVKSACEIAARDPDSSFHIFGSTMEHDLNSQVEALPVEDMEKLSTTIPTIPELTRFNQPDEDVDVLSQAAPMPVKEDGKVEEVSTPETETPPPALELTPADQPDEAVAEPSQAVPLPLPVEEEKVK